MKTKTQKSLSIRIDDNVRKKLQVVSAYEGRSNNAQINYLIRKSIEEYEQIHGTIDLDS